ncbi:MAG: aminotransferase class V-fold PLP-dependent enzyme, partial [Rhodospirillales bacterium]|nr:aminotransferase class V-fold PLP-dependent enzyme [Rhodospirillales bacterium]
ERIAAHEKVILDYATAQLSAIEGLRIYGNAQNKVGIVSFTMEGVHPHDISTIIDSHGVAVRAGHHCAQPLMDRFDLAATARASLGMYNNRADIDQLVDALKFAKDIFS